MTAQCTAISSALNSKGHNNAWLANQVGSSQQRIDAILSGAAKATQQEFSSIARVLGLSSNPNNATHTTS